MALTQEIAQHLAEIQKLCKKYGIAHAYVFGSAVNRNFTSTSDFDLVVEPILNGTPVDIGERLWRFEEELETILGRPIDMLTKRSLKNPFLKDAIEKQSVKLYG